MPGLNEYTYGGQELEVTEDMKAAFDRDGFVTIKGLLNPQELAVVQESLQGPDSLSSEQFSFGRADGEGKTARMSLWNHPGSDTTGTLARTRKMALTAEKLLGGEVYHYHSKLMMKEAGTGGKFVWHQDYGYWYGFACLFPDMLTSFVALDKCDKDNGCLQVLKGSHRCGRIEHLKVAGQTGADMARVQELEKVLEKVYVELDPGDALFFHCNLLHCSSQNLSDRRRWAILSCYSRKHNSPYQKIIHALYQPLNMVDNDAVVKQGVSRELKGKEVMMQFDGEFRPIVP
ncbi:L-proline trans-4-hydroxylase [Aplysia californica]|uniref:L-proline trans-4-hydroxylase n=1 Tax=Aplysia californica TaxID=6500 RepID=A0ABM0K8F7_APLCA|nr:L-proline trans-4-hydroxylase [Aplysia californica]